MEYRRPSLRLSQICRLATDIRTIDRETLCDSRSMCTRVTLNLRSWISIVATRKLKCIGYAGSFICELLPFNTPRRLLLSLCLSG
jgi:hypothetical protein